MTRTAERALIFATAGGFCGLAWNEVGITGFQLPAPTADSTERHLMRRRPGAKPGRPPPEVLAAARAATRYFDGERIDFSSVAVDLGEQDGLVQVIYAAARRIGWGDTTTYGQLAAAVGGGPQAARDVGQAMARNPVPLIIPCHRVLAAGGAIGGFSAPGGSLAKARMLALEGVSVGPPPSSQLSLAL